MDWQAYGQYGAPSDAPYTMQPQGHPSQAQQYAPQFQAAQQHRQQQTWQAQPQMLHQQTPQTQLPPQQHYNQVQYSPQQQYSRPPPMQHQSFVPDQHQQHQRYQQHVQHQQPEQYFPGNRPMVVVPRPSQEYLSQFQDFGNYSVPQQSPQTQAQPSPRTQLQQSPHIHHQQSPQVQHQQSPHFQHQAPPHIQHQQSPQIQYQPSPQIQHQHRPSPVVQMQRRVSSQQSMPQPPGPKPPEIKSEPATVMQVPKPEPEPEPEVPPVDFQLLLMSLADEYITAARGMGSLAALMKRDADLQQYHKLMATGMGCLDAILRKFRLQPRPEASLQLRYATLLYEETNNDTEIGHTLSKGILLAERNRLLDLKYSMQHLQARALFRTKPKAALASIDKIIPDVETLQHTAWIYAFRFLRVSLCLQAGGHQNVLNALQQLKSISSAADKHGDICIFVIAAAFEAVVHLREGGADSVEQSQHALASARRYQLQVRSSETVQIRALLDVVDLACSLQAHQTADQIQEKMHAMQDIMDDSDDATTKDSLWNKDGTFTVPINHNVDMRLIETTSGIFQADSNGRALLTFSWLSKRDLYMLGYFLSGITALQTKPPSDEKASNYLKEGLKLTQASIRAPSSSRCNLTDASDRLHWHSVMQWYMQLQLALIFCNRADWKGARTQLRILGEARKDPAVNLTDADTQWLHYVTALIAQGTGDLKTALAIYQSAPFSLETISITKQPLDTARRDLCLLAALNTLLLIRDPTHPQSEQYHSTLSQFEPLCVSHPNKSIQSAFSLLRSIAPRTNPSETTIVKTKQHLQAALQIAKPIANNQLLAISLSFMTELFFKDIVGEQAEKSARTGQLLAKRARSSLWTAVTDGQLAETLDNCGKRDEAEQIRAELEKHVASLPTPLRELCEQG